MDVWMLGEDKNETSNTNEATTNAVKVHFPLGDMLFYHVPRHGEAE